MKVLITGSSGMIGRWVAERLKEEGYRTIGLDTSLPSLPTGDEHITCDILDRSTLISEVRRASPDALIHLAARTDLNETESLDGYATNIDGMRNVIEAVRQTPAIKRAIYTSSQLVCRIGHVPVSETEYCPTTLYGQSKVLTENIVREEDGGGVEWCLTRPTTVWGPHMSPHYKNMLRLIRKGLYFHCGNGRLYKSYAYAGNIAHQYVGLISAKGTAIHRKTFYLADYQPLSLRDYADGLAREMDAPRIPTVPLALARFLAVGGDVLNACGISRFPFNSFRLNNILTEYVIDLSSTEAVCGPVPFTHEDGIKETAQWYLSLS
ncbi:MAG: NAD(P)-dependent oxidoreductase [Deltaproteobacteria bacterium]|nr:NAD(P)-dependent oxidoreductase [Deltaproteobacteria bacterium]